MFCELKCVVILIKIVASLLLSRSFGNLTYDIAAKYPGGTIITDLRKLEKASIEVRKAELHLNFLRNCQTFNVFPKFLCFQLPNVARQDVISIRKHPLKSAIAKWTKEYRRLLLAWDKLSTQIRDVLNSLDLHILQKAINRNVHQAVAKVIETHTRKLEKHTRNTVLPSKWDGHQHFILLSYIGTAWHAQVRFDTFHLST